MNTYYRPLPLTGQISPDSALRLAGGWCRFTHVELLQRGRPSRIIPASDVPKAQLSRLSTLRAPFSGLSLDRPRLMGILNVTPDSFSDGGLYAGAGAALARASALVEAGADIIDIGGESTRPGAVEVPAATETARVLPIITALRAAGLNTALSVDTRKSSVAEAALKAGGDIINDVSMFRFDANLADVAAAAKAPVILMHSRAVPETMQSAADYDDVLLDVYDALADAVAQAQAAGISRARLLIDPGIGFAKRDVHNLALLNRISLFHGLGCGILLGVSRKGFLGRVAGITEPADRDPASAACGLWALSQGVQFLRVHDIVMHKQMIALWQSIGAARMADEE
ncbi:MAG: dihydropteroate synthase [Pseudomonadota bacterium]